MTRVIVICLAMTWMHAASAQNQQLSLRLGAPESAICKGTRQLEVRLELQNVGSAPIEIDAAAMGRVFDAIALYSTESNTARFESLQVTGDKMTKLIKRSQMLAPGATHAVQGVLVVNEPFFAEPGFYKIRTDYFVRREDRRSVARPRAGVHVTSNWLILQVESCSASSKSKP